MKPKLIAALGILLTATLGFSGLAHTKQITQNSYKDTFPEINGNYLVWQGRVDGDWEIFLCDISNAEAEPIRITHNDYDDILPHTDGESIVWRGFSKSGGEIFLYDIVENGKPVPITNDDNIDTAPRIANGLVVWTSHQVTSSVEPGEIFLYDMSTGQTEQLTDDSLDDSSPRINDETVMWVKSHGNGTATFYIYDLAGGIAQPAPEGFFWPDSPQADANLRVLTRHDGNDGEVFVYNSDLRSYHQVTDNDFEDTYPRISGNHIAWVGGEGQASEICVAFYATKGITLLSPEDGESVPKRPPATFSWKSDGYDRFKVQFCGNPDFPPRKTLTLPPKRKGWLSGSSFVPTQRQWKIITRMERRNGIVYWRVKGRDADGNKDFSEVWSFSIE